MITIFKSGLEEDAIDFRNACNPTGIEVHLVKEGQDLHNMKLFKNRIYAVHMPFSCCDISVMARYAKENNRFVNDVIEKCSEYYSSIVIHCDVLLEEFKKIEGSRELIELMKKSNIIWRIENVTFRKGLTPKSAMLAPVDVCEYINKEIGKETCFPLLDVCHYLMLRNSYDSDLDLNLKDIIALYKSNNTYLHLSDKVGTGDKETGGIHGNDFRYNNALLRDILFDLNIRDAKLCLEVYEDDVTKCWNAVNLDKRISVLTRNL